MISFKNKNFIVEMCLEFFDYIIVKNFILIFFVIFFRFVCIVCLKVGV